MTAVMSRVVLGLLFYVVVTPIALLLRAVRRDLLSLDRAPAARSYWVARRRPGPPPHTMRRPY
jgi:hypothetical protein